MEETDCRLDQSLVKAPFGTGAFHPKTLPDFMGLEKITGIEEENPAQIPGVVSAHTHYCMEHRCGLALSRKRQLLADEARQALAAILFAELAQAARLDLPDTLARDAEDVGKLVQGVRPAVTQTETQFNYLAITRRQGAQHLGQTFLGEMLVCCLSRVGHVHMAQEILHRMLLTAIKGFIQAHRLPAGNT